MDTRRVRSLGVDLLLLTAIVGLLAVLFWPAIEAWQNRPGPGKQVRQQCVVQETPVHYLLYLPSEYKAGSKWPLVVYLHGSGLRGQDLSLVRYAWLPGQVEQGKEFNFILLSPQCPADSRWDPEVVIGLIEHVSSSLSVDRDRVYLTGYSMGGSGAWQTACYDPDRFAAIVPLCGRSDASKAERLVDVPVWAFHGEKDDVVPLAANKAMVDAMRKYGGNVQFTVHPNYGHDICDATYQDGLFEWLLAQRRKTACAVSQSKQDR